MGAQARKLDAGRGKLFRDAAFRTEPCDGAFYRGKRVLSPCGGITAAEDALVSVWPVWSVCTWCTGGRCPARGRGAGTQN